MDLILWLQALEPRAVVRLVFAGISWCGDGPLYFLLFPLLYWGNAPGEWPPLCQAASARAEGEAVVGTGGAAVVVANCRRLVHCSTSQPLQS